jgi:glutathione S-transferase
MTGPAIRATLLTFQPMVDSETTRLIARYHGIDLEERDHLPISAAIRTLWRGGNGHIPLLYGKGFALTSPYPIAGYFDATLPPDRRLIPDAQPLAGQVATDWQTYNGTMGTVVAVFAYYHLLPDRALMQPIFGAPVPWLERALLPVTYPLLRVVFSLGLKLSADHAAAAEAAIRSTLDATDRRIADGRHYLVGDRLTLSDIALCAAVAPLLLPRGYGALMPPVAAMPAPLRGLMEELRARPVAEFVQRLYDSGFVEN